MEASAAGLSGGQGAGDAASQGQQQSAQQQQGGEQQQQAQSPDVVALLNGLGEQLNETREFLKGEPWRGPAPGGEGGEQQQQQTQEQEPGEIDLSFLENPQLTPEAAAKGLQDLIDQRAGVLAEQKTQEQIKPLATRLGNLEAGLATEDLVAEFPQLGDPALFKQVVDHSKLLAEQLGYPQLAADPGFYRMTYLAGRALNGGAGAGGQAADNAAPLEGAGGASPGGAGQGAAPTAEQVTAGWKNQRVPFMSGSW